MVLNTPLSSIRCKVNEAGVLILKSCRNRPAKFMTFILVLLFILVISLSFGQVLGNYYYEQIASTKQASYEVRSAAKKVLRLNKATYYSILVAEFTKRETAVQLGNTLAEKGLPAIITGGSPYRVLLGFFNNRESLTSLAGSLKIDGQTPAVITGEINSVSFKFLKEDQLAEKEVAPFLGQLSTCLHKGLLLYSSIDMENLKEKKPKFLLLAAELEKIAECGRLLAQKEKSVYTEGLNTLAERCVKWSESLRNLEKSWAVLPLLVSQQHALALLENFHRFMENTN